MFQIGGHVPHHNYLFLGDYVDRGYSSILVISLLCCLKLRYPDRVTLLRGNHESRAVTQVYGFYAECMKKYGSASVWKLFTDMFDFLTISVIIDNSLFAVHGGLSPFISSVDEIVTLNRYSEIPHEGPIADMMWSDPSAEKPDFSLNQRGAGFTYGKQAVEQFLHHNDLKHIFRAHQLCMEGFQVNYSLKLKVLFDDQLTTVWSAPNYCYRCGNMASIVEVHSTFAKKINVYGPSPTKDKAAIQTLEYFL